MTASFSNAARLSSVYVIAHKCVNELSPTTTYFLQITLKLPTALFRFEYFRFLRVKSTEQLGSVVATGWHLCLTKWLHQVELPAHGDDRRLSSESRSRLLEDLLWRDRCATLRTGLLPFVDNPAVQTIIVEQVSAWRRGDSGREEKPIQTDRTGDIHVCSLCKHLIFRSVELI